MRTLERLVKRGNIDSESLLSRERDHFYSLPVGKRSTGTTNHNYPPVFKQEKTHRRILEHIVFERL